MWNYKGLDIPKHAIDKLPIKSELKAKILKAVEDNKKRKESRQKLLNDRKTVAYKKP